MANIHELLDQAQRMALQHKEMVSGDTVETVEGMVEALDKPDVIALIAPVVGSEKRTVELLASARKFVELEKFIRDQNVEDNIVAFVMKAKQHKMLLSLLDKLI